MIHLYFDDQRHPHAENVPFSKCCGNGAFFTEAEAKDLLEESYLTEEIKTEIWKALNDN